MSHFYDANTWTLLPEVTTPSQARKHGNAYASVTTKLGIDNEGLRAWESRMLVNLARQDHDAGMEELHERKFGYRTTPSGELVTSSEYGTRLHAALEEWVNAEMRGHGWKETEWDEAIASIIYEIELVDCYTHTEVQIGSHELRTVGTIDLVFEKDEDTYLADYKTRACNGKPSSKIYEKDRNQLAIEAYMWWKNDWLQFPSDKMPKIMTVVYCTDSGKVHTKVWSNEQLERGITAFCACSIAYDVLNGLDDGSKLRTAYGIKE